MRCQGSLCPKSRCNPPKKRRVEVLFPRRFTLAVLLSTSPLCIGVAPFPSPAVAVRFPQHRHFAPHSGSASLRLHCGAWGCLLEIHHTFKRKKKKRRQVYVSGIPKNKFKPCGFYKKSPPSPVIVNEA